MRTFVTLQRGQQTSGSAEQTMRVQTGVEANATRQQRWTGPGDQGMKVCMHAWIHVFEGYFYAVRTLECKFVYVYKAFINA